MSKGLPSKSVYLPVLCRLTKTHTPHFQPSSPNHSTMAHKFIDTNIGKIPSNALGVINYLRSTSAVSHVRFRRERDGLWDPRVGTATKSQAAKRAVVGVALGRFDIHACPYRLCWLFARLSCSFLYPGRDWKRRSPGSLKGLTRYAKLSGRGR